MTASYATEEDVEKNVASIGKPLSCWFWVTRPDDPNSLVPLGTVGELLLESPQLADCYLNDQQKTDALFVKNPAFTQIVSSNDGPRIRRMFRTGDLVKMTADGSYILVGRADRHVKIRGQRVDLNEVEHQLSVAAPEQVTVAVEYIQSVSFKPRKALAAFFEYKTATDGLLEQLLLPSSADRENELTAVRTALSSALPRHMIPTFYVPLQRFPVNESNKLDRNQLRIILQEAPSRDVKRLTLSNTNKQQPRTSEEATMQELWSVVLSIPSKEIGIHDSFLNLGGDSIIAMRLSRTASARNAAIKVGDILRNPVLADMARVLESTGPVAVAMSTSVPVYQPLSLLGEQTTAIKAAALEACPLAANDNLADIHPVTSCQLQYIDQHFRGPNNSLNHFTWTGAGSLDIARLQASLMAAVAKFATLRSVFIQHRAQIYQVVLHARPELSIPVLRTEKRIDDFIEELQDSDMGHPPRLGDPPAQFALVEHRYPDGVPSQTSVVVRLSHAQYDGACTPLIFDYIEKTYAGQPADADEEPPLTQADYMHLAAQQPRQASLDYWSALLRDSAMPAIPRTAPASAANGAPTHDAATNGESAHHDATTNGASKKANGIPAPLPPFGPLRTTSTTLSLAALPTPSHTMATVIKSAWARVLASLAPPDATTDVVFGSLVAARNVHPDAERVVGACINFIPVRVDGAARGADVMRVVAEQAAAGIPHEHVGFYDVARECTAWEWDDTRVSEGEAGQGLLGDVGFFSSLIVHQNLEVDDRLEMGGVVFDEDVFGRTTALRCVLVESSVEGDILEVGLIWQEGMLEGGWGVELCARLVSEVEGLLRGE